MLIGLNFFDCRIYVIIATFFYIFYYTSRKIKRYGKLFISNLNIIFIYKEVFSVQEMPSSQEKSDH